MNILKEVIEVTYSDIVIQSLLCVTVGLILAMVIEEFKKQDMKEVFIKIKYKLKKLSLTGREMFIEDLLNFIKNY